MDNISKITSTTDWNLHFTDLNAIINDKIRILQIHVRLLYATIFWSPCNRSKKHTLLFLLQLLSKLSQRQVCKQPKCLKWGFMWVLEEFLALVSNASYILAVELAISSVIFSLPAYTCLQSPQRLVFHQSLLGFVAFPTTKQTNDQASGWSLFSE